MAVNAPPETAAPAGARTRARVATWNLDSVVYAPLWAHDAKARACGTLVREHGICILALQEVAFNTGQLARLRAAFAAELPTWRVVATPTGEPWRARNGTLGAAVQECHCFAYDTASVTLLEQPHALVQGDAASFKRPPVLVEFLLHCDGGGNVRLTLASVHLRADDGEARAEVEAFGALVVPALLEEYGARARSVVLLGDWNLAPPVTLDGLRLEPECGTAFARLRTAGWRHTNEAPTNLAAIAETRKRKCFDNIWCSAQLTRLLVPDERTGALSTAVCVDEDAFRRWRAERGLGDAEAGVTRAQLDAFSEQLWHEHCRARGVEPQPMPAHKQPTKWFSHARGFSDHRPLFVTLRLDGDAAAALSTPPAMLPRSPVAADLDARAAEMRTLRDRLAAATLDGEGDASPAALRALAE